MGKENKSQESCLAEQALGTNKNQPWRGFYDDTGASKDEAVTNLSRLLETFKKRAPQGTYTLTLTIQEVKS